MKEELLKLMRCPYCANDFEIKKIYKKENNEIINGYLKCECDEFPILHGILNLKVNPLSRYSLKLIKKGKIKKALILLLGANVEGIWSITNIIRSNHLSFQLYKKVILPTVVLWAKIDTKKYFDKEVSFCDLLEDNPNSAYFKHRFSAESLWSVYPFIPLLKENKKRILELGCGRGHASFLIYNYVKPNELVCVDHTFKSLYLARKYFAKNAQFICLDANYSLPFKDNIFSSVFTLDTFHYVQACAQLALEMKRTLSSRGLLLLLHLHNSFIHIKGTGIPLPPTTWINIIKDERLKIIAIPEKRIIDDLMLKNELDLTREYSEKELNASSAISIIASEDISFFKVYERIDRDFMNNKNNLIINPIYKIEEKNDKIFLIRKFPSKRFEEEYPLTKKYLPEKCMIDKRFVNIRKVFVSDIDEIKDLMKKNVVIDVPEKYV